MLFFGVFIHPVSSSVVVWVSLSVGVLGASLMLYVVVACRVRVFVSFSMGIGDRWTTDGQIRFGGVRRLSARKNVRISSVQQSVSSMDEGLGLVTNFLFKNSLAWLGNIFVGRQRPQGPSLRRADN